MADEKITANGNVQYWWIPEADVADPSQITAADINTHGLNLSDAISWDSSTFPGATESSDIDDRSIMQRGNASSRGYAQFEGDLSFFRPKDPTDLSDVFGKVYDAFKVPRAMGYIVARTLQGVTGVSGNVSAGDWIDVMKFMAVTFIDDTEGEDSVKYSVSFLPQGFVLADTQVKNATPVVLSDATKSVAVGASYAIRATLGGKRATNVVTWASSNPAVASVSQSGVVTGVSAGTANITASHNAASAASTACVVTVA